MWHVFSVVLHCVACVQCCTALCGMCAVLYCTVWHVFDIVLHCVASYPCNSLTVRHVLSISLHKKKPHLYKVSSYY